jgi:hypothetical protein
VRLLSRLIARTGRFLLIPHVTDSRAGPEGSIKSWDVKHVRADYLIVINNSYAFSKDLAVVGILSHGEPASRLRVT